MGISYTSVSRSQVARHPAPIGVVQFYGGAFFNSRPTLWYEHLLTSDVAWLVATLRQRTQGAVLHEELAGDHLAPIGVVVRDQVFDVDLGDFDPRVRGPRALEPAVIRILAELGRRRASGATQAG